MTVALLEGHESIARAEPVTIRCRWNPDQELVLRCQELALSPKDKFWRGEAIGEMLDLYPWADLKRQGLLVATEFARNMRLQKQEYEIVGNPGDMLLHGPYMEHIDFQRGQETKTVGGIGYKPLYDYHPGFIYGINEVHFEKGVTMYIVGSFLAKFGSLTSDGKVVIV